MICFFDVKYFIYATLIIGLLLIYMYMNSPFGAL